ncbi:MAG TPA: FAD-dependent oxidoreductase [Acidobacteriota bacterium]|nr:FAD-dependent oxidoreductase [Acidobacteriota bacterium]
MSSVAQPSPDSAKEGRRAAAPDVLVLGAGLGGLAAALELARKGWRVTIVEREAPPWHRLGESFDWETPVLLARLGFDLEQLRRQDVLTVKPGVIIWCNTRHPSNEAWLLPPESYMRMIRRSHRTYHGNRSRLDSLILDEALRAGCRLREGRVRKVHMRGSRVESVELGDGRRLRAAFYIDAGGRSRLVTRSCGVQQRLQGEHSVCLWRRHRHHYDEKGTRLYLLDQGTNLIWIWNIHVDSRTTDIGMVIPAACYRSLAANGAGSGEESAAGVKDAEDVYWDVVADVDLLKEFADRSRVAGPLQTCSFRQYVSDQAAGENWLGVGETAFLVDPISSAGVTVALRSAKFASQILDDALGGGQAVLPQRDRRFYHKRLSHQVAFVNTTLQMLYSSRRLWNRIGVPVYVRLLVLPQFQINWLSSCFALRSRAGLVLIAFLRHFLGGGVRVFLSSLRLVFRSS